MTKLLGANFTAYQEIKKVAHRYQPDLAELPSYQHMLIGLISGAMGPFSNAPIDTIKTREFWRDAGDIGVIDVLGKDCKKLYGSRKSLRSSEYRSLQRTCGAKKAQGHFTRVSRHECSALRPAKPSFSLCMRG